MHSKVQHEGKDRNKEYIENYCFTCCRLLRTARDGGKWLAEAIHLGVDNYEVCILYGNITQSQIHAIIITCS